MTHYSFIDVHSHIHDKAFDEDRDAIVSEMKERGFATITIGTDSVESAKAIACAEKYDNVWATVGVHPVDNRNEEFDRETYHELLNHPKVVALGECGLDYYAPRSFLPGGESEVGFQEYFEAEKLRQKKLFEEQIGLAVECDKPLMLHGRPSKGTMDAYEDMLHILEHAKKIHGDKLRGNAHFFAGNIDIAKRFLDIGFTMSFSGVITFTHDYDDVVRYVPLTMIHAETDSPYATPAPFRGQRNTPLLVQEIVARIAVLREQPMEEVRAQLLQNAQRLFWCRSTS